MGNSYKERDSEYWRTYLMCGVNGNNQKVARKTSRFIIDNIIRYANESKHLSLDGYRELKINLDRIKKYAHVDQATELRIKYYMKGEQHRLNRHLKQNHGIELCPIKQLNLEESAYNIKTPYALIDEEELEQAPERVIVPVKIIPRKSRFGFGSSVKGFFKRAATAAAGILF